MQNIVSSFVSGVVYAGQFVMLLVGDVDNLLSRIMNLVGVSPAGQVFIVVVFAVFLGVLGLAAVRGLVGWLVLIFMVLLALHRIVPSYSSGGSVVPSALQHAL